ncbi:MAG TPA: hypothetical protein VLJ37_04465 [bacterium]|nr:hypothetical protein [bacterium]
MLTIVQGLGGLLQFQNFTPLAPALVTENLGRFWDLAPVAQVETLASAYQHLSRVEEADVQLLESVGQLLQRIEARAEQTPSDSFILSRVIGKLALLKASSPPSCEPPGRRTSDPAPGAQRDPSLRFYSDGEGGFFPPSWIHFSKPMRDALKVLAYGREGKMSDLTSSDVAQADFLIGALSGWINDMKTALTETGMKGAGQSGLASAPSIRAPLDLVAEMAAVLGDASRVEASLAANFWRSFGSHADLRMSLSRLVTMRMAQSVLEEAERLALEDTLCALDAAFLRFLLAFLPGRSVDSFADSSERNETYGDLLAKRLGDALLGLPLSDRAQFNGDQAVQLATAGSVLRTLAGEVRADPPSPVLRGFLKKILPSEMLRLGQIVGLLQELDS